MAKTVLITGASRGIGAAAARRFHAEGWNVAVNYCRSQARAEALCRGLGPNALPVQADVADWRQVQAMTDAVAERFGGLDALVCNAGVALPGMVLQDVTSQQWERLMAVDVNGVYHACRAALPYLLRQHRGSIVTISSIWGQVGGSCEVAYSAAKGAVLSFSRALAKEVGPSGITVNVVAPGVVDTDMMAFADGENRQALAEETPLGRLGTPEEVAAAIYFLCSGDASFITGQVLGVNGGFGM
ncbi:MAG: 3-oxoacyl-ACP reductase FabG [Clostridiales bacterium]|nr:3-oxoacyl-ACP reductase FabG [Clostridiales bacterium]